MVSYTTLNRLKSYNSSIHVPLVIDKNRKTITVARIISFRIDSIKTNESQNDRYDLNCTYISNTLINPEVKHFKILGVYVSSNELDYYYQKEDENSRIYATAALIYNKTDLIAGYDVYYSPTGFTIGAFIENPIDLDYFIRTLDKWNRYYSTFKVKDKSLYEIVDDITRKSRLALIIDKNYCKEDINLEINKERNSNDHNSAD